MKFIINLFKVLVLITIISSLSCFMRRNKHKSHRFKTENKPAFNKLPFDKIEDDITPESRSWMSKIPDSSLISTINIPGTHDSGTMNLNSQAKCQSLTIAEQLKMGIRYFDLRFGTAYLTTSNVQKIEHGAFHDDKYTLDKVFSEIKEFLADNNTEGIIIKLVMKDNSRLKDLRKFEDFILYSKEVPTMGQFRGKAWILMKFKDKKSKLDTTMAYSSIKTVQSNFKKCKAEDKKKIVKDFHKLHVLFKNRKLKDDLLINQLSCSPIAQNKSNIFTYPVNAAEKINSVVYELDGFCGIVVMDFPSPFAVQYVFGKNTK